MRRALMALAAFAAVALWGGVATAGEYHMGSQLVCSDCHTMHYSQQHAYDSASAVTLPPGGPNAKLLRSSGSAMCLSCHDGQTFAPDVLGANTGTHLRQAGALNDSSTTGTYEAWMGHTLGVSATPPGGSGSTTLECKSCHKPHGNASYRNIDAGTPITYAKGTNVLTQDVFIASWTLGSISTNYAAATVNFNEPLTTGSAMGQFCKGCHTNFHGASGDSNMKASGQWIRHPTADSNITGSKLTQYNAGTNRVKVMSPTGVWTGDVSGLSGLSPSCFSCHKSHGNKNAFGLIFLARTGGTVSEEGTTTTPGVGIRNLCGQCHNEGN